MQEHVYKHMLQVDSHNRGQGLKGPMWQGTAGAAHHDFLQLLCIRFVPAVAAIRIVQDPCRLVCGGALGQPPHLCRLQLGTRRLVQFLPDATMLGQ